MSKGHLYCTSVLYKNNISRGGLNVVVKALPTSQEQLTLLQSHGHVSWGRLIHFQHSMNKNKGLQVNRFFQTFRYFNFNFSQRMNQYSYIGILNQYDDFSNIINTHRLCHIHTRSNGRGECMENMQNSKVDNKVSHCLFCNVLDTGNP